MPYKGSAQAIGFRNRTVIDPSQRMRQEAEQLERQEQQRIRGMERQASQQIQDMSRVSNIVSANAEYELKALTRFSDTLLNMVEEETQKGIERERYQGMVDYMNQPPEALAQDKEEVDAAINRTAELHVDINKFADKAPTPTTEALVRKRSMFYKQGWDRAAMMEGIQGLGAHLIAELESNETELPDPRGGTFKINDKLDPEQFEVAVNYLKQEWLKNNNPSGLSAKMIATQFMPKINEKISFLRDQHTQEYVREQNQDELDGALNALTLSLRGIGQSVPEAIATFRAVAPKLYSNLNAPEGGNVATTEAIMAAWKNLALSDPNQAAAIIPDILAIEVSDHPAVPKGQTKKFGELFAGKGFTAVDMNAYALKAQNQEYAAQERHRLNQADEQWKIMQSEFMANPPNELQKADLYRQLVDARQFELAEKVRTFTPLFLGLEESEKFTKDYLANSPTKQIPAELAAKLHPDVRAKYQKHIVDKLFGADSKETIKKGLGYIDGVLRGGKQGIDKNTIKTFDYLRALEEAEKDMMATARIIQEANPELSESEAITKAAIQVSADIKQQMDQKGSKYYYETNKGFETWLAPTKANAGLGRQHAVYKTYEKIAADNPNAAINQPFAFSDSDLELTADGRPPSVFYAMAKKSGYKFMPHEIFNAQRKLRNPSLADTPLPPEAKAVDDLRKQYPSAFRAMANPSYKTANRVVQQTGSISPSNMLRAIGIQESGGNYKAINSQSYGMSNPALGKYQMLWKNVLVWGPKYGLGHPGTMDRFRNSPQYQEKLAQAVMGEYIRQAVNASNGDMNEAVRRAAAFWYGGQDGFRNWNNPNFLGGAPGHPNMAEYTASVLQHYLTGN